MTTQQAEDLQLALIAVSRIRSELQPRSHIDRVEEGMLGIAESYLRRIIINRHSEYEAGQDDVD